MWPTTVIEWISLVAYSIGLLVAIGGVLGKWFTDRLNAAAERLETEVNGLGDRVDARVSALREANVECQKGIAGAKAILETHSYEIQGIQHHRSSHERELAEMREMIRGLSKAVDNQRDIHSTELKIISESVVEIKTTVKLLLKKGALD